MAIPLDDRNLGGRKHIYSQLYNHKKALSKVKPSVNIKPPRAHVDQGGEYFGTNKAYTQIYETGLTQFYPSSQHSIMTSTFGKKRKIIEDRDGTAPEYAEVRETFRRVQNLKKGGVDHQKPKCFHLSKKLNENRRRNMFHFEEHIKNLASLQRRIDAIGTIQDRKKNPTDPLVYPSKFFRKPDDHDKKTSLEGFANKVYVKMRKTKTDSQKYENIILDELLHKYQSKNSPIKDYEMHRYEFYDHLTASEGTPQNRVGSMTRPSSSKRQNLLISALQSNQPKIQNRSRPQTANLNITPKQLGTRGHSYDLRSYNQTGAHTTYDQQEIQNLIAQNQRMTDIIQKQMSSPNPIDINSKAVQDLKLANLLSENMNELRLKLVQRIVDQRLYKDDHLNALFEEAVIKNPQFNKIEVQKLCQQVKADLDSN